MVGGRRLSSQTIASFRPNVRNVTRVCISHHMYIIQLSFIIDLPWRWRCSSGVSILLRQRSDCLNQ